MMASVIALSTFASSLAAGKEEDAAAARAAAVDARKANIASMKKTFKDIFGEALDGWTLDRIVEDHIMGQKEVWKERFEDLKSFFNGNLVTTSLKGRINIAQIYANLAPKGAEIFYNYIKTQSPSLYDSWDDAVQFGQNLAGLDGIVNNENEKSFIEWGVDLHINNQMNVIYAAKELLDSADAVHTTVEVRARVAAGTELYENFELAQKFLNLVGTAPRANVALNATVSEDGRTLIIKRRSLASASAGSAAPDERE